MVATKALCPPLVLQVDGLGVLEEGPVFSQDLFPGGRPAGNDYGDELGPGPGRVHGNGEG